MNKESQTGKQVSRFAPWFDNLVAEIRGHEIQLETNVASAQIQEFYNTLFGGDVAKIMQGTRESTAQYFVRSLVGDFLKDVTQRQTNFLSISISYSDSQVRIWAVIKDADVENEERLFKSEAVVNAKYFQYGFHLSLTIVEESDNIKIPPHFETIITSGKLSGTLQTIKAKPAVSARSKQQH